MINKIEYFAVTNKEKLKTLNPNDKEFYILEFLSYFLAINSNVKSVDLRELIDEKDDLGYSLVHYVCSLSIIK